MIGNSTFDYVFIQSCIYGLHVIAPLSLLYCLIQILRYGLTNAASHRIPILLELWAASEATFYLLVHFWYRSHLQSAARHPPAPSREARKELFELCNANIPDPETYLRKWFLGAPTETIKRGNLKEFLLWAFFNRGGPPADDNEELEEYVVATERLLGRKIEAGRGSATCLRLTLDQVTMLHRSILWYSCVGFVDFLTFLRMQYCGFHFYRLPYSQFFTLFPLRPIGLFSQNQSPAKHLTYWHRPHTSKTKLPIVFIHGIGIGLYPYVDFFKELNSDNGVENGRVDDQVGIIAIEIMPVSFRITHPALVKEQMCAEIQAIVKHHGFEKYVLVSHSYGTAVATQMLKSPQTARHIGPVVLIDPISILLHLPDVAYNFTRRKPSAANEHQLYYFGSMDMGVSHTLARGFFWSDVVLWKEDLGDRRVTVSLAEKDLIVNTEAVGRYIALGSPALTSGHDHIVNGSAHTNGNVGGLAHVNGHTNGSTVKPSSMQNGLTNGSIVNSSSKQNGHANGNTSPANENDTFQDWKTRPWSGEGLEIMWQMGIDHAQVFDSAKRRKGLIAAIKTYCIQPVA